MAIVVREAETGCEGALQQVERVAGERFREVGLDEVADAAPLPIGELATYVGAGRCWIAVEHDEIVGYVLVDEVDANAHIEQISVVPQHQGRGAARLLLGAAEQWALAQGATGVTLTTFTDVPWNRALYEHLGFRVMDEQEIGPQLRRLRQIEAGQGLAPESRVCMHLKLPEARPAGEASVWRCATPAVGDP